ncbi:tetratricopeptide repeat protein [Actinoplanes sp. NPDC051494]|uniref:tetratricopeptide repeat protein n=1 Tax=Actinoplanes sp. NPDC051494 TaxID=3363907 RepID=UPI0037AB5431
MSAEPVQSDAGTTYEVQATHSYGVQTGSGNTQINIGVNAASLPPAQSVGTGPVVHNLPQASAVFVGRDLRVLAEQLNGEGAGAVGQVAVHGLGGIGKSEFVNHYARAYMSRHSLVWWITAGTAEGLRSGLASLTRRLHPVATLADAQEWAVGWLQANPGWLLVLDNVEDLDHVTELLGAVSGRGQVLVTTRRELGAARWARSGLTPLRVEVLNRQSSIELLSRLTARAAEAKAADRLADELGDLPLALEQAAAYISQHDGMNFDQYRALLCGQFHRVAGNTGHGGKVDRSIAAVWTVTMAAIARTSPLGVRVIDVLAWLSPDGLPDDVLAPLAEDPADVVDALSLLMSYSMINHTKGCVGVHRLVQAVARMTQRAANVTAAMQERAVELLDAAIPDDPTNNVQGWPRWDAMLPHVDSLTRNVAADHHFFGLLNIRNLAATYRQGQGQINAAIAEFEAVVSESRRILGENHPFILLARSNLAVAYRDVGWVVKAVTEFQALLPDHRRVLGEDHRNTLNLRDNLAGAYSRLGRVETAIEEFEAVLADYRRVLGGRDLDTLIARNNLALEYHKIGQESKAITELEELVDDYRHALGEAHPETLTARQNLAQAYLKVGRVPKAISQFKELVADRWRLLGKGHPSTLISRNSLAVAYWAVGRRVDATTEFDAVLLDSEQVFGPEHHFTKVVAGNLTSTRNQDQN